MTKKRIAVDIDDVIAAGAAGFAAYSNDTWGHDLTAEDFNENFMIPWGVSMEEALKRVDIYLSSGAHGRFEPLLAALPALKKLAKRFELVVVTSRRNILKPETDAWLDTYFPGIFSKVVYAGIYDNTTKKDAHDRLKHTKADIVTELQADYLIDDHPKHCFAAAQVGVTSLLFGDYKWNRDIELPNNVVRTRTWLEVLEYLNVAS